MKRSSRILKTASRQQSAVLLLPMKALENGRKQGKHGIKGINGIKGVEEDISSNGLEDVVLDPDWSETASIRQLGSLLADIERAAYERGFSSGEETAQRLAAKENEDYRSTLSLKNEQVCQTLSAMMDEVGTLKTKRLQEAQEDILAIALAIVRRILGQGAEASREAIVEHIAKAIKKVGGSGKIIVRLPPLDLNRLSEENDSLSALFKENAVLKFEADVGLSSGECIVEGPDRMVDGRFESQIALFTEALKERDLN